ncbi:Oligoribonuclease, mitochondrial [Ilyodon furcidens]|uniref:Oligoribonuclease, mitochondrial n=1 Tax=Ilyodon furcidens TaxID=33524 RepID=A0ABV0UC21_9TELE
MTGLDIEKDRIIEMACIITDSDLNIIAEGPTMIINQPDELLNGMSNWCKEHHGKVDTLSGLIFCFVFVNEQFHRFLHPYIDLCEECCACCFVVLFCLVCTSQD